jgi:hypothetical protein
MKTLAFILLSCACFAADEPAKTERPKSTTEFPEEPTEGEIPGWGFRHNPKRTGKYEAEGDALKLTIASGADLNPQYNVNAPAALTEVEGDFVAEVTMAVLPTDHRSWVGGGFAVMGNTPLFIRFDRIHSKSDKATEFSELMQCMMLEPSGEMSHRNLSSVAYDRAKPSHFRIERRGDRLHCAFSNDGTDWKAIYPFNIRKWPAKVRIGPYGINISSAPKTLTFSGFKVTPKAK